VAARDSREILERFPPPAADARVVYGVEPLQFGDLRLPPGGGPHPLLVVLHGGYWKAQYNLIHTGHLCSALAAEGIATWNVEYRRVGDVGGGWPGTLDDVRRALSFVPELASRYALDTSRVVLFGHSAGGHLALCAGREAALRGLVAVAAVSDPVVASRRGAGGGAVDALLGGAPEDAPDRYRDASPLARLPLGISHVLVHGTADDVVPYADSVAYVEAAAGEAELVTLEGTGHFEPIDPLADAWATVSALIHRLLGT
jgi:acetyl esterase/lipase